MNHPQKPIKRRDATGHINPQYARDLLRIARETRSESDDAESTHAFISGPHSSDELAEEMGESFVRAITSGDDQESDRHDRITEEENGGPFIETTASEEFAGGTDESNIAEATREPLPRTSKADP